MSALLHLIEGLAELWCSWRLYLCLGVGLGAAFLLHRLLPEANWILFISVPLGIASFVLGVRRQVEADREGS